SSIIRLADGDAVTPQRNVACDSFTLCDKEQTMKQATLVRNYWIGVVSKTHVDKAVAGGFTQLNHGKAGPLERMREGDGFAFYSPRVEHPYGAPLQAFTAIGRVGPGAIFQAEGHGFIPFRRAVDYLSANEAPIKPLLEGL